MQEESFAAFANDAGRADAAVAGVVSREYVRTQRDAGRRRGQYSWGNAADSKMACVRSAVDVCN